MSGGMYSPEALLDAIKMISRAVDSAGLETLEEAHALLEKHFLTVTESRSLANAAEQRVLGVLWAEIEIAVDVHRARAKRGDADS